MQYMGMHSGCSWLWLLYCQQCRFFHSGEDTSDPSAEKSSAAMHSNIAGSMAAARGDPDPSELTFPKYCISVTNTNLMLEKRTVRLASRSTPQLLMVCTSPKSFLYPNATFQVESPQNRTIPEGADLLWRPCEGREPGGVTARATFN